MAEFEAIIDLSTLDGTTGFRLDGVTVGDRSGTSVASAGDINGDGLDDIIIGAPGADPNDPSSGSSYVVFGQAGGFASSLDLSALDGTIGFRLDGVASYDRSGFSVASAGDVNGDGFDDLIIGAPYADPNGSSYVVFGQAGGFAASFDLSGLDGDNGFRLDGPGFRSGTSVASAGDINGDGFDDLVIGSRANVSHVVFGQADGFAADLDLSGLDGTTGFRLDGAVGDRSGKSVASAGDVNGDGFDDLIIGAYAAGPGGSSYVVFGQAGGFAPSFNLSGLDGTDGFRLDGVATSEGSGWSVASAGDVNGDGFDDLVIGAPGAESNGAASGSSYVVFGQAGGFAPSFNLSGLDGTNGFRLDGSKNDEIGWTVASAGDVNGDGFDDLIVGGSPVPWTDVYVVFGGAGGFAPSLDLSALNGTNGFRLEIDGSGRSVASAGDVNGDGFDDLIVGAAGADYNATSFGSSYVIFGRAPDAPVGRVGSAADQTIRGGAFDDTLAGVGGADSLFGGGGNDLLLGGEGNDELDGGTGDDSFVGGLGDDLYVVDSLADDILEKSGEGIDRVLGSVDGFALPDNVEILELAGTGDLSGTGNGLDNEIIGNAGHNTLHGAGGNDALFGHAGDDTLLGGEGDDVLHGGDGADLLGGGDGADRVYGEAGNDRLHGALGDDLLVGGGGNDRLYGGDGADLMGGGDAADRVYGEAGNDSLYGASGDDLLVGGGGNDRLYGGDGADLLGGGDGADRIYGQAGNDRLYGASGDDVVSGGGGNDVLYGGHGDDLLGGGDNDDVLLGNGGDDRLFGGAGDDRLVGGVGNDRLIGKGGMDSFVFQPDGGNDVVVDFENDLDLLDFSAFNFADAAAVLGLAAQSGVHVLFTLPDGGTVQLNGFDPALLGAEDILV